ncbi:MAG: hypothetical protein GY921_13280, partial [Phycisphaeraceae bacterium]|nr:hypothetical protein [Phycisphaeraceae bacterium]
MWFAVTPLAALTDLTPEASRHAVDYVRTMSLGMPLCGVMMVGSMCLFGAGETLKPSLIAAAVNVVNVISSWLLSGVSLEVAGLEIPNPGGVDPLEWGVTGIAAGTATSWAVGGLITLAVLFRGVKDLRLELPRLRPERSIMMRVVKVGIPTFFEGIAMWAVSLVVVG